LIPSSTDKIGDIIDKRTFLSILKAQLNKICHAIPEHAINSDKNIFLRLLQDRKLKSNPVRFLGQHRIIHFFIPFEPLVNKVKAKWHFLPAIYQKVFLWNILILIGLRCYESLRSNKLVIYLKRTLIHSSGGVIAFFFVI